MLCIKSLNSFKIITICSKNKFILKKKKKKKKIIKKVCLGFEIDEGLLHETTPLTNNFLHSVKKIH